jgi:transcriptional regulator with PAS, ATPase and Fis domain
MQCKLLRALQEKEIHRIGGHKSIPVDVRIISATHRDLEKMVEEGTFRQDLFYRLNVVKIEIPPLRERNDDIELLSGKLLEKLEKKFYRKGIELSSQVIERLGQHNWLGNIRELENVLERAINVLNGNTIEIIHLPLYLQEPAIETNHIKRIETNTQTNHSSTITPMTPKPLKEVVALVEKQAILHALAVANGNKLEAAKILEVSKTSFYEKCKLYQIK